VLNISKYFAYIDVEAKEFDFTDAASLLITGNTSLHFHDAAAMEEGRREQDQRERVEDYWDHLPNRNKAVFYEFNTRVFPHASGFSISTGLSSLSCQVNGMTLDYSGPPK